MIFPAHQPRVGVRAYWVLGLMEQEISYLLATRVDFGSVKHHTAVNITTDGCAVLFRSEIDDRGAEIPPRCHIEPYQCCPRPPYPHLCSSVKVVLFGEIEVNPSDVKHVTKLVGCNNT